MPNRPLAALAFLLCLPLVGCSSYERIESLRARAVPQDAGTAQAILDACALAHFPHGLPTRVTIATRGEWSRIADALQPELCDRHWRGPSTQTYDFAAGTTHQRYTNPQGVKEVFWNRRESTIRLTRAGTPDTTDAGMQCAALVADSYPFFLAGAALIKTRAGQATRVGQASATPDEGPAEVCDLVSVTLKPGFGLSAQDEAVLWVGQTSHRLHKMQMTLRGFEPTRTAEVTLSFLAWRRDADGNLWPTRSREYLYRPAPLTVYEWQTTVLGD